MFLQEFPLRGLDGSVVTFGLPIILGLVSRGKHFLDTEYPVGLELELGSELWPIVCEDGDRRAVDENPITKECARDVDCVSFSWLSQVLTL